MYVYAACDVALVAVLMLVLVIVLDVEHSRRCRPGGEVRVFALAAGGDDRA